MTEGQREALLKYAKGPKTEKHIKAMSEAMKKRWRTGSMNGVKMGPHRMLSEKERFEKYFQKIEGGCWIWKGASASEHRKSWIRRAYFHTVGNKTEQAARTAYRLYVGVVPKDHQVCHHCDNGLCVNPAHLFLGTPKENSKDMIMKGHSTRGEKSKQAKITRKDVIEIRKIPKHTPGIAARFGISRMHITRLRRNESWAWLCN